MKIFDLFECSEMEILSLKEKFLYCLKMLTLRVNLFLFSVSFSQLLPWAFFNVIPALDLSRKWKTHGLMNPSGNSVNKFLNKLCVSAGNCQ